MYTAVQLVDALVNSPETSYVRIVAHWLTDGEVTSDDPGSSGCTPRDVYPLIGRPIVDAIVAAAVAHLALQRGTAVPDWANGRRLDHFWHPGSDAFFANALARSPVAFKNRGVLIERDSLESV